MKDAADNKTRNLLQNKNAERQAAFRERMKRGGYKQKLLWTHDESYKRGADAARSGSLLTDFPDDCDAESWAAGFCSVAIEHEKLMRKAREALCKKDSD